MIMEMVVFKILLAAYLSASFLSNTADEQELNFKNPWIYLALVAYALASFILEAVLQVAIGLAEPWGSHADDLPAEEFLLAPYVSHRALMSSGRLNIETVETSHGFVFEKREDSKSEHMFLRPLSEQDQKLVGELQFRSGWAQMKKIGAKHFRRLSRIQEDAPRASPGLPEGIDAPTLLARNISKESFAGVIVPQPKQAWQAEKKKTCGGDA